MESCSDGAGWRTGFEMSTAGPAVSTGPSEEIMLLEAAPGYSILHHGTPLLLWLHLTGPDSKAADSRAAPGPVDWPKTVPIPRNLY